MEFGLLALWLVVFGVLWVVGLPLADLLFDSVPGTGAGFAVPVSLGVLTIVVYWVGQFTFGLLAIGIGVTVLLAASGLAVRRGASIDPSAAKDSAAVFVACFLFMAFAQAKTLGVLPWNEDFLDYGLLKSLLRASELPPEDMWLAGRSVNYYYGGHLLTAILARVTGTAPRYAYSLAIAGFYAMVVTAAYELAGTIATAQGRSRRVSGFIGALVVGFGGTLVTTLQMLLWTLPALLSRPLANALGGHLGTLPAEQLLSSPAEFEVWKTAFVIPGTSVKPPLFAWFSGDLHAHKMSIPFLLLLIGVLYVYYRTPFEEIRKRQTLVLGIVPVLVGFLALLNSWDVPTALGLVWLTLTFDEERPLSLLGVWSVDSQGDNNLDPDEGLSRRFLLREAGRIIEAIAVTILVAVISVVVAFPYLSRATSDSALQFVAPGNRSGIVALIIVHGAFLVLFLAYLETYRRSLPLPDSDRVLSPLGVIVGLGALLVAGVAWYGHLLAPLLLAVLLVVVWISMRTGGGDRFETVPIVAGLGLIIIVEFVYLAYHFDEGRFNTVYKIYEHVWVLWGVATGAIFTRIATGPDHLPDRIHPRRFIRPVLMMLVVLSMLVYAGMAVDNRFGTGNDASLDSLRFAETEHPMELEAIQWLDDREGTPTMVSAPGIERYTWKASTGASFTGIPTLAGQVSERQYHGPDAYNQRVTIVDAIYNGSLDRRIELLTTHDVTYVWVGPGERERYGTVRPFDDIPGVSVAFENEKVSIYHVDESELSDSKADD
jgi:YYY domain-containing protein